MHIARTIARILFASAFIASGLAGYAMVFHMIPTPTEAPSALAKMFQTAYFASNWVLYVDGLQFIAGVLLLINRYAGLALAILAGIIVNITIFHLTMAPQGIPVAIVFIALWVFVAWPIREKFMPLLSSK